jgi:hypothetical protein
MGEENARQKDHNRWKAPRGTRSRTRGLLFIPIPISFRFDGLRGTIVSLGVDLWVGGHVPRSGLASALADIDFVVVGADPSTSNMVLPQLTMAQKQLGVGPTHLLPC